MSIPPNSLLIAGYCLADKYEIEQPIGHGGSGVVYAARNILLNDRVAIKVLYEASDADRERLVREARAAVRIRSEHVVRVFDVGEIDEVGPYIVMEYLEGEDLAQRVKRSGPLDATTATDCLAQVCDALSIAHDLGIVHRDLKPANLFQSERADGSPWVKILDFGISKTSDDHADGLTSTHAVFGTPAFMSPEQLRSTRDVDHRTDIWALGAILFYLVTGRLPFPGESSVDVAAKVLRDETPSARALVSGLPEAIDVIIERCMRKEPGLRWKSIGQLMQALEPLCSPRYHELIRRAAASTSARRLIIENEPTSEVSPFLETAAADETGTNASWPGARPKLVASPAPRGAHKNVVQIAIASSAMFLATVGLGLALWPSSSPGAAAIAPVALAPLPPPTTATPTATQTEVPTPQVTTATEPRGKAPPALRRTVASTGIGSATSAPIAVPSPTPHHSGGFDDSHPWSH